MKAPPLGATLTDGGVEFAVHSAHATRIEVCVFDANGDRETGRFDLSERSGPVWHGRLPGAGAGLVYGLRAHGPWRPHEGHRFTPAKLLLDPYARAVAGRYRHGDVHLTGEFAHLDNAADMLKAVVVDADDGFDWQGVERPCIPMPDTVIYETHVKGFSQRLGSVPAPWRGTYAGLASDAALDHFRRLGITSLCLLPVHLAIDEPRIARLGRTNHWGYNTLGFFVPTPRYAVRSPDGAGDEDVRTQFKRMVRELHRAGFEVILDVVYNHTAEGDGRGPTLAWRGLDNTAYYRLDPKDPGVYRNWSGCGNTLDLTRPAARAMVLDSLRYWAQEFQVDGFRFDLAVALGRGDPDFDAHGAFFADVAAAPELRGLKLIAEPWDLGPGGYRLGGFPKPWSEWNDRFRNTVRAYWVGVNPGRGELAARLAGSHDVFGAGEGPQARGPHAGINYVTAHDGFTLHDLVSYDHKHNEANGEGNRDGSDRNHSWNCGVEGPTELLAVNAVRARLKRALVATLALSRGVPMILSGDEISRTQHGNNNGYLLDDPDGWLDWARADTRMLDFFSACLALRRRYPQLRGSGWLTGAASDVLDPAAGGAGRNEPDVQWLNRRGEPMSIGQWENADRSVFGMQLAGARSILMVFNASASAWQFPILRGTWRMVMDTGRERAFEMEATSALQPASLLDVGARSIVLLEDNSTAAPLDG